MLPTIRSISDVESAAPQRAALSPETQPSPTLALLQAAEALAHSQIKAVPAWEGSQPINAEFCTACQRSRTLAGFEHATSCKVGAVLAAAEKVREAGPLDAYFVEYRKGWADGQAHTLQQIAIPPAEQASAQRLLEAVTGPCRVLRYIPWAEAGGPNECEHGYAAGIACPRCVAAEIPLTAERAEQIQREFDAAARHAQPVEESEESWQASEAILRPTASWDHGDFASAGVVETRRVVCGRAIAVSGHAKDVFTCDRPVAHGEAGHDETYHHDSTVDQTWTEDVTEIHFHPSGMVERRLLGQKPRESRIFDYSDAEPGAEVRA